MIHLINVAPLPAFHSAALLAFRSIGSAAPIPAPWFAVRIREKYRASAQDLLRAQGFEFFSPMITETHQWSDRRKAVTVPLFAGYVFCRFNPDHHVAILRTPGVIEIVHSGARFCEVDPRELQAVDQALRSQQPVERLSKPITGQRVRMGSGPMQNVEGVLLESRSHCKLVLSVGMMNRSIAVHVERSQVEAAP